MDLEGDEFRSDIHTKVPTLFFGGKLDTLLKQGSSETTGLSCQWLAIGSARVDPSRMVRPEMVTHSNELGKP